jgi:hypothetical protein
VDLQFFTNDEAAVRERFHVLVSLCPLLISVVNFASIFFLFILLPYYHITIVIIIGSLLMFLIVFDRKIKAELLITFRFKKKSSPSDPYIVHKYKVSGTYY